MKECTSAVTAGDSVRDTLKGDERNCFTEQGVDVVSVQSKNMIEMR